MKRRMKSDEEAHERRTLKDTEGGNGRNGSKGVGQVGMRATRR